MRARHYSPELGRFLQPDPGALEANLYGYAGNSPVTKVDPEGTCFWCPALEKAVDIIRRSEPFLMKLPSALSAFGNRYGRLVYVARLDRSVRVFGQGAHNFTRVGSGRLSGFARWVSELPGGSRGAQEVFRSLTGRIPGDGFTHWRSYRGYLEVVYRPTSATGGPVVEITNHVTKTLEWIHFVIGGGR